MTETAKSWDGVPDRADRDGWHWLDGKPAKWLAHWRSWGGFAAQDAANMVYAGPVDTPGTSKMLSTILPYAEAWSLTPAAGPHCREVVAEGWRVLGESGR